jgi:hypothetical protein
MFSLYLCNLRNILANLVHFYFVGGAINGTEEIINICRGVCEIQAFLGVFSS